MADSIYQLHHELDDPRFEGLAGLSKYPSVVGRAHLGDDFFTNEWGWNWTLKSLTEKWTIPTLEGRVAAFNDFPCIDLIVPAFSERAVEVLRDLLEPNGELLPVNHPSGTFFAFNCLKIVEILDQSRCQANWFDSSGPPGQQLAVDIKSFALKSNDLSGLSVFRFREWSSSVFVTNHFVDRVKQHGLNGFDFVKAWPYAEGAYWRAEAKKLKQQLKQAKFETAGSPEYRAQSLVIQLDLASEKSGKEEKVLIRRLENELDAQLVVRSMDDPFFGSLEGKKFRKGSACLFLSCPDSQKLFRKLMPWLKTLSWPTGGKVFLRNVPFDDFVCDGESVTLDSL